MNSRVGTCSDKCESTQGHVGTNELPSGGLTIWQHWAAQVSLLKIAADTSIRFLQPVAKHPQGVAIGDTDADTERWVHEVAFTKMLPACFIIFDVWLSHSEFY